MGVVPEEYRLVAEVERAGSRPRARAGATTRPERLAVERTGSVEDDADLEVGEIVIDVGASWERG